MLAVRCRGLCKVWPSGVVALDGVDLEVGEGEPVILMGPSGAGKTTLIRLVSGLERLDAGEIQLWGETVAARGVHLPARKRGVGMVFQDLALWPHLSARTQLELVQKREGTGRKERRAAAERWLERVGLQARAGHEPGRLSGGERRRLALARGMIGCPRLLLLDEPFAELPSGQAGELFEMIRLERNRSGLATIVVSHLLPEGLADGIRIIPMAMPESYA